MVDHAQGGQGLELLLSAGDNRPVTSANLNLVRSIYADWERGDFLTSFEWAHDEIEFEVADGPEPGSWTGLAAMAAAFRERMSAWADYRFALVRVRELDGERVLALNRRRGRGKTRASTWRLSRSS